MLLILNFKIIKEYYTIKKKGLKNLKKSYKNSKNIKNQSGQNKSWLDLNIKRM